MVDAAAAGVSRLNVLGRGFALDPAKEAVKDDATHQALLMALDGNQDGLLTFEEILTSNPLQISRDLLARSAGKSKEKSLGDDAALEGIVFDYFKSLAAELRLGIANETEFPKISVKQLQGDVTGFLNSIPAYPPYADLEALADAITLLNADPQAGEMTGANRQANAAHKAKLIRDAGDLSLLLLNGNFDGLAKQLELMRSLVDGKPQPPDWVAGKAATALAGQIDLILSDLNGQPQPGL